MAQIIRFGGIHKERVANEHSQKYESCAREGSWSCESVARSQSKYWPNINTAESIGRIRSMNASSLNILSNPFDVK